MIDHHETQEDFDSLHMMFQLLQTVDVGVLTVDREYQVYMWNSFMENHSGIHTNRARGYNLFALFPELPAAWLKHKIDSVFRLQIRAYSDWKQQPHLFRFRSSQPLTGKSELMYQNVTMIPLSRADKVVSRVCLMIHDVTDIATSKLALQQANKRLTLLSRTDRLTGLNNRGYWEECLHKEFLRCQRGKTASLILFDIDHFKPVNDRLGHQAGDEVLRHVSEIMRDTGRQTDIAGRYGGEEFGIILPDTSADKALILAERLRRRIADSPTDCGDETVHITVSLGICEFHEDLSGHHHWLELADRALYCAKRDGRDQSCLYEPQGRTCETVQQG